LQSLSYFTGCFLFNSFHAIGFACFHCYKIGGVITHLLKDYWISRSKHRGEKKGAETRDKSIAYACCSLWKKQQLDFLSFLFKMMLPTFKCC